MSTITTRAGKGSPLTNNEVDANFTNLNTDKAELSGATFTGDVASTGFSGDITGAVLFQAKAGEALTKGDPVYISGISGNQTVVSKADANDANKMPCFGIVDATVSINANCSVVTFGTLSSLDTSAFSEGDELYISDTGTLSTTAPTGEASQLQKIAKVTRSHASAGSIKVMGAGRTNATPNLDDGKFFLGNSSNQSVSATFSTSVTGIALPLSGGAMTGAITTNSTFDGRDVATDGTKLDGIEASADVTDTANVTAAGALMDSELTSIASVKALNQGVATTDSPTFAGLTTSADVSFGDNDKAIFGAGSDLQIYHDGSNSYISDQGTGNLVLQGSNLTIEAADGTNYIAADDGVSVYIYHPDATNQVKLSTTSTGIDITGTVTADGGDFSGQVQFNGTSGIQLDNAAQAHTWTLDDDFTSRLNIGTGSGSAAWKIGSNNNAYLTVKTTGIDVTGNMIADGVGIGTSPATGYKMDILGASGYDDIMRITGVGTNIGPRINLTPTGTGISRINATANSLQLQTSGTPALTIDSSQNVGIGASSPDARFHSYQPAANYAAHFESANANSYGVWVEEGASANNGYPLLSVTDNGGSTQYFRVDSGTGNVGIGTSSPAFDLDILDTSTASNTGAGVNIAHATQPQLRFAQTTGNYRMYVGMRTNDLIIANDSGAEKVRFEQNGNVGIGVSPSSKFHVKGDANTIARIEPNNNSGKATLLVSSTASGDGGIQYDANNNQTHLFSYSDMTFNVGNGNLSGGYPANERMRIESGGGISTYPAASGTFVINENGVDADFRVESDGNAHMLFVDAGTNKVGIGVTPSNISSVLTIQSDTGANSLSIIGRNNGSVDESVISFYEYDGTTRNAYIVKESGELAFATGTGGSPTEKFRIASSSVIVNEQSNDVDFRVESDTNTHAIYVDGGNNSVSLGTSSTASNRFRVSFGGFQASTDSSFSTNKSYTFRDAIGIDNPNASSYSTATAAVLCVGAMSTGRSINATGTVNASGADYAEYEANNGLVISKGSIVGFKADGTLTLTFSEAVRFAVKSTDPAYVGGDTWSDLEPPEKNTAAWDTWFAETEAKRAKVDRVAYSGKVPVNVQGATAGQYIIAVANSSGEITGQAVTDPDFSQYKLSVGRVNKMLEDGRAELAVIIH